MILSLQALVLIWISGASAGHAFARGPSLVLREQGEEGLRVCLEPRRRSLLLLPALIDGATLVLEGGAGTAAAGASRESSRGDGSVQVHSNLRPDQVRRSARVSSRFSPFRLDRATSCIPEVREGSSQQRNQPSRHREARVWIVLDQLLCLRIAGNTPAPKTPKTFMEGEDINPLEGGDGLATCRG